LATIAFDYTGKGRGKEATVLGSVEEKTMLAKEEGKGVAICHSDQEKKKGGKEKNATSVFSLTERKRGKKERNGSYRSLKRFTLAVTKKKKKPFSVQGKKKSKPLLPKRFW